MKNSPFNLKVLTPQEIHVLELFKKHKTFNVPSLAKALNLSQTIGLIYLACLYKFGILEKSYRNYTVAKKQLPYVPEERDKDILKLFCNNRSKEKSLGEISNRIGLSNTTVNYNVRKLNYFGILEKVNNGPSTKYKLGNVVIKNNTKTTKTTIDDLTSPTEMAKQVKKDQRRIKKLERRASKLIKNIKQFDEQLLRNAEIKIGDIIQDVLKNYHGNIEHIVAHTRYVCTRCATKKGVFVGRKPQAFDSTRPNINDFRTIELSEDETRDWGDDDDWSDHDGSCRFCGEYE